MRKLFARLIHDESGATAIEYGLILALMAVAILTAISTFGNASDGVFKSMMDTIGKALSS